MTSHTLGNISLTFWYEQGEISCLFSLQQPSHNSRQIYDVLGRSQISQAFDGFLSYIVSMSYAKKSFLLFFFH